MVDPAKLNMAQQVAQAAGAFQLQRTGHMPREVTVVLSQDTLTITLHGALTPAEQAMAMSADGAAKVQEFHRQLFLNSFDALRSEISRITGVQVREAAAEVVTAAGTAAHAFTAGTMVQVFQLAQSVPDATWTGTPPVHSPTREDGLTDLGPLAVEREHGTEHIRPQPSR